MPKVGAKPSTFAERMGDLKPKPPRTTPLWAGPGGEGHQGGITQSLLGRYVSCAERFRIKTVDGLRPVDKFSHRLEYGNMWHVCEEHLAGKKDWEKALRAYCQDLNKRYRTAGDEITHWFNVCKVEFPVYIDHWKKQPDVKERTPLLQEQIFDVPYTLPSGRVVRLRGKWDSVDLIGKGRGAAIYIQENKSKGEINTEFLRRQLSFDLQSMMYLIALQEGRKNPKIFIGDTVHIKDGQQAVTVHPIRGVRYNVVRRPLAGGKHTITQWKPTKGAKCSKCKTLGVFKGSTSPKCQGAGRTGAKPGESKTDFYKRVEGLIKSEPSYFFYRWKVDITEQDVEKFKREFFHPCLENLCDDYEWWALCKEGSTTNAPFDYTTREAVFPEHRHRHWRLPYGVYNPVAEGNASEVDELLATGSATGLTESTDLFRELVE